MSQWSRGAYSDSGWRGHHRPSPWGGAAWAAQTAFGYSDGFSQPRVDDPAFAQGNSQEIYPRGHFILDEWDEKAQSFPRKEPW